MAPLPAAGLPQYRSIVAVDIERSTSRPNPIKGELRKKTYELFEGALRKAGVGKRHHDRFIDRGDGILALIRPVDQVPKALLLNRAVPALHQLLSEYNYSLPRHSQPQRQLRVRVVADAETATLTIEDTGPGIEPEVLAQVFEPFFTTKEAGTGLGLSIVRKIIDQHRGEVRIESERGVGTRAIITLPRGAR